MVDDQGSENRVSVAVVISPISPSQATHGTLSGPFNSPGRLWAHGVEPRGKSSERVNGAVQGTLCSEHLHCRLCQRFISGLHNYWGGPLLLSYSPPLHTGLSGKPCYKQDYVDKDISALDLTVNTPDEVRTVTQVFRRTIIALGKFFLFLYLVLSYLGISTCIGCSIAHYLACRDPQIPSPEGHQILIHEISHPAEMLAAVII